MAEELQIQTPFLKLAARAWGPVDGLPVLALHGWLDNAASFDPLAPLLAGCRVVALDLPGHGLSGWRPAGIHYHFVDFVPDVLRAAAALGWEKFVLLGHSLGASIAGFAAAVAPDRVERLILIDGIGPWAGNPIEAPAQLAKSMEQMRQLAQKRPPVYRDLEEAVSARRRANDLSHAAAVILAERGLKAVNGGFSWRNDPVLVLKSPLYVTEDQVLAFLAFIHAPTLLIQAEAGYLLKRENTAERMRQIPRLQMRILDGGHHLHMDDPASTAAAINEFLQTD